VTVALAAGVWFAVSGSSTDEVAVHNEPARPNGLTVPEQKGHLNALDIESLIRAEVQAARLAASARVLAAQPELIRFKQAADRYLARAYGSHAAASHTTESNPDNGT
jgi:hypothetical protein